MPKVMDLISRFRGCRVFSKLDLRKAFYQIPVCKKDIDKTAITTPFGLFMFNRMPFGLRNAPKTFQRLIDTVLQGIPNCVGYVDDIMIGSKNADEHFRDLQSLFERLKGYGLRLKLPSADFLQPRRPSSFFNVSGEGIRPSATKLVAIRDLPLPNSEKHLKRFLGLPDFIITLYRIFPTLLVI